MLKIGIIGIAAVFFAVLLKRDRPELSMLLSVACGTIIFFCIGAARHNN